jgi:hypothetical protein
MAMLLKTKGCMTITPGDFWVEIQEKKTLGLWICQLSGDKDFYFLEESLQIDR